MINTKPNAPNRAKIVTIRNRLGRPNQFTVTQRDLAEERLLTKEADAAVRARDLKRDTIKKQLNRGELVEPGIRTARVSHIKQKAHWVKACVIERLIVN